MGNADDHSTENENPSLFTLQPNLRNVLIAFLCLPLITLNCVLLVKTVQTITKFNTAGVEAKYTYALAAVGWFMTSVLAPIVSLIRIHRGRIRTSSRKGSWLKILALHFPRRNQVRESRERVFKALDTAGRFAEGERVYWDDIPKLKERDKLLIRQFVEEGISFCREDTGTMETSAWLLIFSHLILSGGIMLAGRFASVSIIEGGLTQDFEVGKELGEWLANYVLVFVGFLQVISRGGWFYALSGICHGPFCSMTNEERNGLVALYIAMSDDTVHGLKRERSYSKVRMNGIVWSAPKVRSTVLIALDESFVVDDSNGRAEIRWGAQEETVQVRTVGYT